MRKILIIVCVTVAAVLSLTGCKKRPSEAESGQEVLKTPAEYEAEAKGEISKKNMMSELERIEKALERELSQEQ